ncbi:MAG: hydroxyacylglutathione hydrolase [Gallionella sp.]|nr:hydroxyacylglutathione hydrolase [Gallionella sp.]
MLNITAIPALRDNYIWAIHDEAYVAIVDPGEASPVFEFLNRTGLKLTAILCTHRHNDHVGGIAELRGVYNVPVYGRSHPRNPHITNDLHEGNVLKLDAPSISFDIIETPGHLEDHIVFIAPNAVFCGDIMFGAGCGNNFEGTLVELHHSLQRLAALPDDTRVYCAHEYTEYCLTFAAACEPANQAIQQRIADTQRLRAADMPTVPSTIALEKATNPFIRCTSPELIHTLQTHGLTKTDELAVFTALQHF